jgi:hypothetical protein
VEVARERNTPEARYIWDKIIATANITEWGASQGFYYLTLQDNVYYNMYKIETTVLPLSHAANPYTSVTIMTPVPGMHPEQLNEIGEEVGIDNLASLVAQGTDALRQTLSDVVAHKATPAAPATPTANDETLSLKRIEGYISTLLKSQRENLEAVATLARELKSVKTQLAQTEATNAKIKATLALAPRQASSAATTIMSESETTAVKQQQLAPRGGIDPFFADLFTQGE